MGAANDVVVQGDASSCVPGLHVYGCASAAHETARDDAREWRASDNIDISGNPIHRTLNMIRVAWNLELHEVVQTLEMELNDIHTNSGTKSVDNFLKYINIPDNSIPGHSRSFHQNLRHIYKNHESIRTYLSAYTWKSQKSLHHPTSLQLLSRLNGSLETTSRRLAFSRISSLCSKFRARSVVIPLSCSRIPQHWAQMRWYAYICGYVPSFFKLRFKLKSHKYQQVGEAKRNTHLAKSHQYVDRELLQPGCVEWEWHPM